MENKYLWIDAADFQNKGEWVLDTQFVHLMGSPYLLAVKAPGIPVEDANTKVQWTGGKMVRAWVRTKNWYYPYAPGIFNLAALPMCIMKNCFLYVLAATIRCLT